VKTVRFCCVPPVASHNFYLAFSCLILNFLFISLGEPIDERGPIVTDKFAAIHAEAPEFVEMNVAQEILVTGIKVVDLLAPYAKGGKIGTVIIIIFFIAKGSNIQCFILQVSSVVLVSVRLY
jgi:F0F1-type ATP synthase beta subunit